MNERLSKLNGFALLEAIGIKTDRVIKAEITMTPKDAAVVTVTYRIPREMEKLCEAVDGRNFNQEIISHDETTH